MEIRNDCADLPTGALRHVRRGLSWIHPADLKSVAFVRLIDKIPPDIELRLKERKSRHTFRGSAAFYLRKEGKKPAGIVLIIPKILRGVPGWCMWTTVPTLLFARVLAHEVGHHLIERRGYTIHPAEKPKQRLNEYEEEMVDRYAFETVRKMRRRWHYSLGVWITKHLSYWHYEDGREAWDRGNYKVASEQFLKACWLNTELEAARQAYWQAKERAERDT
jgi:hypothetical protein